MKSIFLSYSWADADKAEHLDTAFAPAGIILKRDIRELAYKDSIRSYMQTIREADYALLLISDSFLKSANCMYEVLEVLKEKNCEEKILPVIVDGTKIFTPTDKLEYIKYWQDKFQQLEQQLIEQQTTSVLELYEDLKHYSNISQNISGFFAQITDMNMETMSGLISKDFKPLLDHLGLTHETFIQRILAVSRIKDMEQREIELDLLDSDYPNTAQIAFVKGALAYDLEQYKKSSHHYRRAIELNPKFPPPYYNLAYNVDRHDEDYKLAEELYLKAISMDPQSSRAPNNLARLYSQELGNPKKARELYESALSLDPHDADANFNLASLIYKNFEDFDTSASYFQKSIEIEPSATAHLNYGLLLRYKMEEVDKARIQFERGLALNPVNKSLLKQMGLLFERDLKDVRTAKRYFDLWIKQSPTADDHYVYVLFLLQTEIDEYKSLAKSHYHKACKLNPKLEDDRLEVIINSY